MIVVIARTGRAEGREGCGRQRVGKKGERLSTSKREMYTYRAARGGGGGGRWRDEEIEKEKGHLFNRRRRDRERERSLVQQVRRAKQARGGTHVPVSFRRQSAGTHRLACLRILGAQVAFAPQLFA